MARLGFVLKINVQEEVKDGSPSKIANKLSDKLANLTLEELVAKMKTSASLEDTQNMQNLNNQQDGRYSLTHLIQYIFQGVSIYLNRRK